jgi:RimJ/RimL family protein N-acetyltransferase
MIKIRKEIRDDMKYLVKWFNDPQVTKFIGDSIGNYKGPTLKEQKQSFDKHQKDKDRIFFTICDDKNPIGWMGLSRISKNNKNASIFIAIGEDEYRGK